MAGFWGLLPLAKAGTL